jgi:hypothetical protein
VLEVLAPAQRKQMAEMKAEREANLGDGARGGDAGSRR